MPLEQDEQDRIWSHLQNRATSAFDLSYPRLHFFAARCLPGTKVLNVGVGTGYLEELLTQRGVEVFSLDPSEDTIERLQLQLRMGPRAQRGYAQEMPFDDRSFDKVIMTEVLEHLPDGVLQSTLDEVRRVLKDDAEFTGTVPYREDLAANQVLCPRCETQFHRWGHEQRFDENALGRLLTSHGFRIDRMYPRTFPDFSRRDFTMLVKATVRYILGRLGEPVVGPNLYFRARPAVPTTSPIQS
jgi:SAM-dependent methyltransferase